MNPSPLWDSETLICSYNERRVCKVHANRYDEKGSGREVGVGKDGMSWTITDKDKQGK